VSDADTLDRLVGEILARLFGATVGGRQGPTAAALRDAFYRDRYEALTGQRLVAPPEALAIIADVERLRRRGGTGAVGYCGRVPYPPASWPRCSRAASVPWHQASQANASRSRITACSNAASAVSRFDQARASRTTRPVVRRAAARMAS